MNRPRRTARPFRARGQGTRRLPQIINRCTAPGIAVRSVSPTLPRRKRGTCHTRHFGRRGRYLIIPCSTPPRSTAATSFASPSQRNRDKKRSFVATSLIPPHPSVRCLSRPPAPRTFRPSLSGTLPRSRPPSAPPVFVMCAACTTATWCRACASPFPERSPAWGGFFVFASE